MAALSVFPFMLESGSIGLMEKLRTMLSKWLRATHC